jgi:DNA-binding NarL/FixJ family response regulator
VPTRVFIVEDLKRTQSLLADLFDHLGGYEIVGTHATEAEAKAWLEEHSRDWDLAVVDLVLEQGSGLGVVERCRSRNPDGRVVVFSSYATPGVHAHCLRLGADAVFEKSETAPFIAYCAAASGERAPA